MSHIKPIDFNLTNELGMLPKDTLPSSFSDTKYEAESEIGTCHNCESYCNQNTDECKCDVLSPCVEEGMGGHEGSFINVVNNNGTKINCGKKKTGDSNIEYTFLREFLKLSEKNDHFKSFLEFMPYTSETGQETQQETGQETESSDFELGGGGITKYRLNLCKKNKDTYMIIKNAKIGLVNPVTLDFKIGEKTAFKEDTTKKKEDKHWNYLDKPFSKKGYRLEGATNFDPYEKPSFINNINVIRAKLMSWGKKLKRLGKFKPKFFKKEKFDNYFLEPQHIFPSFLGLKATTNLKKHRELLEELEDLKDKVRISEDLLEHIETEKQLIENEEQLLIPLEDALVEFEIQINKLKTIIENNKNSDNPSICFVGSSVLLIAGNINTTEGDNDIEFRIKLIDFAHPYMKVKNNNMWEYKHIKTGNTITEEVYNTYLRNYNDGLLKLLNDLLEYVEQYKDIDYVLQTGGKSRKSFRKKNSRRRKKITRRINKRVTNINKKHKRTHRIKRKRRIKSRRIQ